MTKLENGTIRIYDSGKYFIKSDDSGKYFPGSSRKVVKLEHRKSLVIAAGGDLAEIRPLLTLTQKWRNLKMGIIRSGESGKYFLKSDDPGKYFSENSRKVVKLEHRKSLVIVARGNLAEIHPLLALTQKWRNLEIGSSEVAILGNTFSKVMVLEILFGNYRKVVKLEHRKPS